MLAFNLQVLRALSVLLEYRRELAIIFPVIGRILVMLNSPTCIFLVHFLKV